MLNGVSTRTPSKDVDTPHYHGASHIGTTLDAALNGYTKASAQLIPISFGFDKLCSGDTFAEIMAHSVNITQVPDYVYHEPTLVGDNIVYDPVSIGDAGIYASSSKKTAFLRGDFERYDLGYHEDESKKRMDDWTGATTGSHAIECFKQPKFTELTVVRHERLADPVVGKYVTDIVGYDGPINELGKRLSQDENLRQSLDRYDKSSEGIELALEKSGDGEDIELIGVTSDSDVIYSIGRLNGKVRLSIGSKAYEHLSRAADAFGVTLEEMVTVGLGEEAIHNYRRSYDQRFLSRRQLIEEERATKQELLEFYERLAEGAESNPRLREKYMRMVKSIKHDIETIYRYNNDSEAKTEENDQRNSDLEEKVDKESEATDEDLEESAYKANKEEYSKRETKDEEEPEKEQEATEEGGAPAEEG